MDVSGITITASVSKSRLSTTKLCSPEKEFKGNYITEPRPYMLG